MEEKTEVFEFHDSGRESRKNYFFAIFNLMNAIVGAGMLSLSFAVKSLGILLYGIMLVIVGVVALYSIVLLLRMCDITGHRSYEEIAFAAFGKRGMTFVILCITLHTFGCLVGFLMVVKYELPSVVKALIGIDPCVSYWFTSPDLLVVIAVITIVVPLASAKDINFLGYTSGFAMLCMIFCAITIVVQYVELPCPLEPTMPSEYWQFMFHNNDSCAINNATSYLIEKHETVFRNSEIDDFSNSRCELEQPIADFYLNIPAQSCEPKLVSLSLASVYAIPTMVFAFQCHASVLPIYAELKQDSSRMRSASTIAICIVFVMYLVASCFGYLTFTDATGSELFVMYSGYSMNDPLTLLGRILVLCCVILSAPVLHFPCRKAIIVGIWGTEALPGGSKFSLKIWLLTMVCILVSVIIMVLYVPNIKDVFGLGGATVATLLMIVMPSGLHYKLSKDSGMLMKRTNQLVVFIGLAFGIFSVGLIIQDWLTDYPKVNPCQTLQNSLQTLNK